MDERNNPATRPPPPSASVTSASFFLIHLLSLCYLFQSGFYAVCMSLSPPSTLCWRRWEIGKVSDYYIAVRLTANNWIESQSISFTLQSARSLSLFPFSSCLPLRLSRSLFYVWFFSLWSFSPLACIFPLHFILSPSVCLLLLVFLVSLCLPCFSRLLSFFFLYRLILFPSYSPSTYSLSFSYFFVSFAPFSVILSS